MKSIILSLLIVSSHLLHGAELDLGSRTQPLPAANHFGEKDYFVWCSAPVKGPDGKFHLFYSRWPVKVGFAPGWAIHSEIAYAVADQPLGPYKFVHLALPARGVNPATAPLRVAQWDLFFFFLARALLVLNIFSSKMFCHLQNLNLS